MNYPDELISLLFPKPLPTPAELEERFPERQLPEGAIVTRFAPSPTGFIHIGGIYIAMIGKNLAHHSHGVYFIRIEDTDQKRKVEDYHLHFDKTFEHFHISSDENDENSKWGPYTQSQRSDFYLAYVKSLVQKNRAYPCFCTKEMLEEQTNKQQEAKLDLGYYGKWATCRHLSPDEVEKRIKAGDPYVIRFKAGGTNETIVFDDLIRGKIKAKDNTNDVVILKSSSNELPLPTYHLAHAVDDHLMRVNLVLRSDEWFPSVPLHFQLFDALGFKRIPYAHIAPLMKLDGKSKRKLSKRKDPEASVGFYMEQGYPANAVLLYLQGLANSRLADCLTDSCLSEPIRLDELQKSGALMDMEKLKDISSNYISTKSAVEIRDAVFAWAQEYDTALSQLLKNHWEYVLKVIDADRFNSNGLIRKDLYRWVDFRSLYGFFFTELFEPVTSHDDERIKSYPKEVIRKLATAFESSYEEGADNTEWFENIKKVAAQSDFALNNKEYKQEPSRYSGTIKDATQIIRIAITGKSSSPGLYEVCNILGRNETVKRLSALSELN